MSLISEGVVRPISLHVRIWTSLYDTALHALWLGRTSFQCFLISQVTRKHITMTDEDQRLFRALRTQHFGPLFVHGSYWINIAAKDDQASFSLLKKELALAQHLTFSHYVLHPGATQGSQTKDEGLERVASRLNTILHVYKDITIVLENSAHEGRSLGGDLNDLKKILSLLNEPERVLFCLDTAHAFAWGYLFQTPQDQESFIEHIDQVLGLHKIALLHLNDTLESLGSKKDRHAVPGQGLIGKDPLRSLMLHKRMCHIPIIVEVPALSLEEQQGVLAMLDEWQAQGLR